MKKVGVIGLGNMGKHMAVNLVNKGFSVAVFDINERPVKELTGLGAFGAKSPREVASISDVIVLSLPNVNVLAEVIQGPNGILSEDVEGKTIIDTTSATFAGARELAESVAARGGWMLDSPVTGGSEGSRNASLSIMVGGDFEAFSKQKDVYDAIGSNIVYIGESGHGQISKMVNQMLMAAIYCSVTEAFAFASQAGVDIARIYDAIESGGAQSRLLSGMKKTILSGEVVINDNLAIHGKDIDYAMEAANKIHAYIPITASTHEIFNIARIKGLGNIWSGSMYTIWEDLLQKKLNSTIKEAAKATAEEP